MNQLLGEALNPIINNNYFQLGSRLCGLFLLVFSVALIFWTWRDADRRGAMAWFWAIVVMIFNVFGWAIYMVVRPPEYADDVHERELEIAAREGEISREGARCPSCLKTVDTDFLICPYCMKKLKKQCVSCGRALKIPWSVCPYCKTKQPARGEAEAAGRGSHAPRRRPAPATAQPAAPPATGVPPQAPSAPAPGTPDQDPFTPGAPTA